MNFVIPSIYTAIDKFSPVLAKIGASAERFANRAQASVARVDRAFRSITPALSSIQSELLAMIGTAAIVAAAFAGVSYSVDSLKNYEKAVNSFRTIVSDLSDKDFEKYKTAIGEVARDTKKSTIEVAQAFEMIAGLNEKFADTPAKIKAVTAAAITLAKASGDELGPSAANLTGILNQFDLAAEDSAKVINVLAAGQAVGASSITQTAQAFQVFGAVAKESNLTIEESVALTEVMGKKQIFASEAGTALRGTLIKLKASGLGYTSGVFKTKDALVELNKNYDKLKTAKEKDAYLDKVFGTINSTTGLILKNNIKLFDEFTGKVTGTNAATEQAKIKTQGLTVAIEQAKAKWVNIITTSGNVNSALHMVTKAFFWLGDNMESVIKWGLILAGVFVGMKIIIWASNLALTAYNIVLGITNALQKKSIVYTEGQAIASKAGAATTWILTAAQWAWNAAMAANPIGLVVAAIAALIVLLVVAYKKWNEWGAALSIVLGPLGTILSVVQAFRRNWDMINQSFASGGVLSGFVAIGKTIIDAVLMPLQQVFKLLSNVPGLGSFSSKVEEGIFDLRKGLGVNVSTDETGKSLLNPEQSKQDAIANRIEMQKQNVAININDKTGKAEVETDNNLVPIKLSNTLGFNKQ